MSVVSSKIALIGFLFCISLGISVSDSVHGPYVVDGRSQLSAEGIVY